MADRIQFRRDDKANWEQYNPVLADGEIGIERDTQRFKLGDGVTHWVDLVYSSTTLKENPNHFLEMESVVSSEYDGDDRLVSITYANGAKILYEYAVGNLSKESYTDIDGSTVFYEVTYEYADNKLVKITRSFV